MGAWCNVLKNIWKTIGWFPYTFKICLISFLPFSFMYMRTINKEKSSRLSNNLLIFYHYLYLYLNKKVACYLECSNLGPNPRSKFPCMAFKSAPIIWGKKIINKSESSMKHFSSSNVFFNWLIKPYSYTVLFK